jgi:hypothetical protein
MKALGFEKGKEITLDYLSGVQVKGTLKEIQYGPDKKVKVLKFADNSTTVTFGKQILFKPEWGEYDLLAGATITSSPPLRAALAPLDVQGPNMEDIRHSVGYKEAISPDDGLRFASEIKADGTQIARDSAAHIGVQRIELGSSKDEGVAIIGKVNRNFVDENGHTIYLGFDKQEIKLQSKEKGDKEYKDLPGQGYQQHPGGFSTPVGVPLGFEKPLEAYSRQELEAQYKYVPNARVTLLYPSGLKVEGELKEVQYGKDGKAKIMKFKSGTASVVYGKQILYRPEWGEFDMALGAVVTNSQLAPQ